MDLPKQLEVTGFPITLVFSDDKAYLSERVTGCLWELSGENSRLIKKFPIVNVMGHHESGLLGIALDPNFGNNKCIYCYYTVGEDIERAKNVVSRIQLDGADEKTILDNIPAGRIHNGGVIAFGPDGKLYILVGIDNDVKKEAQNLDYLGGKVIRINSDGSIPDDNPFPNSPIYSYGHRNLFGIAFHPETEKAYVSESGPDRDDEINIIEKGGNYGWPEVTGYADSQYIDPVIAYTPTLTPTQSCFVGNHLYFGSYNEGSVHRLTFKAGDPEKVLRDEVVYRGRPFGIIGVFNSPNNKFYVATQNKIMQIELTVPEAE